MQVVVLDGQPGVVIPRVMLAGFHAGLVLETFFLGIALPPGINAVVLVLYATVRRIDNDPDRPATATADLDMRAISVILARSTTEFLHAEICEQCA